MTAEEIQYMELTVNKWSFNDSIWKQAFDEYNKNNVLVKSMNCKPCYMQVLKWHKENSGV